MKCPKCGSNKFEEIIPDEFICLECTFEYSDKFNHDEVSLSDIDDLGEINSTFYDRNDDAREMVGLSSSMSEFSSQGIDEEIKDLQDMQKKLDEIKSSLINKLKGKIKSEDSPILEKLKKLDVNEYNSLKNGFKNREKNNSILDEF
jgi:hypothetical protein